MHGVAPSKLTPPALPRDLVPRPALREALDGGAGRALTLVCAPAGFGKSLLLADWVKRSPGIPAAWVSLDEDDADPRLLWSSVLAALRACPAVPPSSRLHRLVVSRTTVELDFIDDLLDGLAALPQPLRLILDDAYHLRNGRALDELRLLVRGRGPLVHLVVASRLDPALPLARLRLDDELCELRAEQLRFTVGESAALVERNGVRLDARQCGQLHARTGGWVAGLRFAARAMRRHPDPVQFLAAFSGDERAVADYLVGEVLAGTTDLQREVLRRTSVADPVPAAMAVELCGREDAADVLDSLARDLGLVTTTGPNRTDYRVEELLRSHLLGDLHRYGADHVTSLHRRAARWCDREGRPADALRHAGQTGDAALVTNLLRGRVAELVARGEHAALSAALAALDNDTATASWRAALTACLHLERGDGRATAEAVRHARSLDTVPEPDLAVLLTTTERLAGVDRRAPGPEPAPDDPALRALARAGRGAARVATGAPGPARTELEAALDDARRLDLPFLEVLCLCMLGAAAWAGGDLREAARAAATATAAAREGGWEGTGWAAAANAVAGLTALEQARPDAALDAADAGLRAGPADLDPVVRFALRTVRGGALFDRGEKASGLLELQQARADVSEHRVPVALAAVAALLEYRIALQLGYATAAAGTASRLGGRPAARAERRLVRAWSEAAGGAFHAARVTVAPLLHPAARPAWPGTVVEACLVASHTALHCGDRPAARQALRAALDRGRELDVVRPFTLAPSGVRSLIVDELAGGDDRSHFAARVLAAPHCACRSGTELLTAREHDVLSRLPSLLNLDEIAEDLAVSVNTVKSHVRSIYDKLGAGTRRAAVLAAHEHGLLWLRSRPSPSLGGRRADEVMQARSGSG
ncbi:LuxR C-terminal-related transcriptional regulator [Pseudonocardia xinjiangensis]|uniref:LuxR C-terminal-related transcriptional regulator n=1 Tax=Pseudonocardia xinjiangensis TaxID=75289 RepID=UPI003D90C33E